MVARKPRVFLLLLSVLALRRPEEWRRVRGGRDIISEPGGDFGSADAV